MKLSKSCLLAVAALSSANAFAPTFRPLSRAVAPSTFSRVAMAEEAAEEAAEISDVVVDSVVPEGDVYARLGIEKAELALGIDATEFLQWIGSKGELVAKFQRDNKGMDEERASAEVSKFLMDPEMVNSYIKFEKDKIENPPDRKAEAEQQLSDPKTIATYAAWLIGGSSFGYIRKTYIEPKYQSGEWEPIHIPLPNWFPVGGGEEAAADAAQSVGDIMSLN